jgi:hypothetical protein
MVGKLPLYPANDLYWVADLSTRKYSLGLNKGNLKYSPPSHDERPNNKDTRKIEEEILPVRLTCDGGKMGLGG